MSHLVHEGWLWLVVACTACVIGCVVLLMLWLRHTRSRRHVMTTLRHISDRLLHHVVLPDGIGGHIAIDALLLRDGKLYLLMLRDAEGAIFGAEKMDQWTAISRHRRFNFRNPLYLMQDQVLALRALLPNIRVEARILFTRSARFPKGRPDGVQLLEEFAKPMQRAKQYTVKGLNSELENAWNQLHMAAGVPSEGETPAVNR